jgi:hypothetical protein
MLFFEALSFSRQLLIGAKNVPNMSVVAMTSTSTMFWKHLKKG